MAYVRTLDYEDALQNYLAQGAPQPGTESSVKTAAPAGPMSAGKDVSSPTREYQPFASLSDYLKINAPQVQEQAENIVGELGSTYEQARSGAEQAGQAFGAQVTAGYTQPNETLVNEALANPVQFVQTPENVEAFAAQRENAYVGPTDFAYTPEYQEAQKGVMSAKELADLFETESGVGTYLQGKQEGKTYTPGMQALDTVLLRQNPEAIQSITTAAQPFASLSDYLASISTKAGEDVQSGRTAAETVAQQAKSGLETTTSGFQTGLEQAVTDRQNLIIAQQAIIEKLSANQELTADDLSVLNISPDDMSAITNASNLLSRWYSKNVDLGTFITPNQPGMVTKETLATPEQYAYAQALAQLAGLPSTFLTDKTAGMAGTAPSDIGDLATTQAQAATIGELQRLDNEAWAKIPTSPPDTNDPRYKDPNFVTTGIYNPTTGAKDIATGKGLLNNFDYFQALFNRKGSTLVPYGNPAAGFWQVVPI